MQVKNDLDRLQFFLSKIKFSNGTPCSCSSCSDVIIATASPSATQGLGAFTYASRGSMIIQ